MITDNSTVETLSTARSGWARLTGMVTAARRHHAPVDSYFESGLMAREVYRL